MSAGDTKGPLGVRSVLGVAGLSAVLAAVCIVLAQREEESQHHQRAISVSELNSFRAPPLLLESIRQHIAPYRRVSLRGSYDHTREILLRGREHGGEPGFHVITPLRVQDGAFLVVRGWIPLHSGGAGELAKLKEAGEVLVTGFPLPAAEASQTAGVVVSETEWPLQVDVVRPRELAERLPYSLYRLVVQQLAAAELPTSPVRLSSPGFNDRSHARRATGLYIAAALLGTLSLAALLLLRRRR